MTEQGFRCPSCGEQTRVKETRALQGGGLRRRRICPGCRAKFTTAELLVATDWAKQVRSKGPVVAVRKRDLRRIADIAMGALSSEGPHSGDLDEDPPGEGPLGTP